MFITPATTQNRKLNEMIISRPSAEDMIALTEGKSAKALQCITTTALRAQTLLAEGYKIAPTTRSLVYEVQKPPQLMVRTGEMREFDPYIVDAAACTCTCPMFAGYGTCKHSLAVVTAVADAMALLIPIAAGGQHNV